MRSFVSTDSPFPVARKFAATYFCLPMVACLFVGICTELGAQQPDEEIPVIPVGEDEPKPDGTPDQDMPSPDMPNPDVLGNDDTGNDVKTKGDNESDKSDSNAEATASS
jgi:hypothetical protein